MKGQYLTLEYVLFFSIGIVLVVLVYGMFNDTNDIISGNIRQHQMNSVTHMIAGSVVNVYEASQQTNSLVRYKLEIPTSISDCAYSIFLSPSRNLLLECINNRNISSQSHLYNFNIKMKNILYSTRGSLTIMCSNGEVEIL